jgi:putative restriction endonuclease
VNDKTQSADMAKAVLTTKVSPAYDDLPEFRYHFPATYLNCLKGAVGDWVLYYEPRRTTSNLSSTGGRQAYFATARLDRIEVDPAIENLYYGFVSDYIEFDQAVPFSEGDFYYESKLKKESGSTNKGAFGRAVREIPESEYDLILQSGFSHVLRQKARLRSEPDIPELTITPHAGFGEAAQTNYNAEIPFSVDRPILEQLVTRPFREKVFSAVIKNAYCDTCAMTGLKIINGGGRSEVQAAHIRPVAEKGPDSIRNGIALSATVHWMFDRGLVSIDDDFTLLVAKDRLPDIAERLFVDDRKLILPPRHDARPHAKFLAYHRNKVFKG